MEFSKKILYVAAFINVVVIGFTLWYVQATQDGSPLAYLIPAVAAETATGTGWYYAKAKAENRIKLMKDNNIKPKREDFHE
ncbi:MAG: hypothetical protein IJL83_02305 [Clostridia bacterium]|nr:hypothetical protein [Clostridia bacterium]